jgi:CheY-like chemotaxis protein
VNNVSSTDGITGTALAREHQIDTIVVDFNMPDLDGNQVTQVLLMKEQPTLPVVISSGALDDILERLKWLGRCLAGSHESGL